MESVEKDENKSEGTAPLLSPQNENLDKGQMSPLSGAYLLIILSEPHVETDREKIIKRLNTGLLSWDGASSHVDLNCELLNLTNSPPEGDVAKNGEKLVQWASENLVVEVLYHAQVNTLIQCVKNLLSSFTRYRHIIHAGYSYQGTGSWLLQDGTFSLADFIELWDEPEVYRLLPAYKSEITVSVHTTTDGSWATTHFKKEPFSKLCSITVNPGEKLNHTHNAGLGSFVELLTTLISPAPLAEVLKPSEIVGNIRFTHPTLYVFPGGQGDAALFGVNGFNMLIDGGYSRKACFWDFTRHLDRLDAVLLTRVNNNDMGGIGALLERKNGGCAFPQVGHFFGNLVEKSENSLENLKGEPSDPLVVNIAQMGFNMFENLRGINMLPHFCHRESSTIEPINLYHKVGHGKLDMYVLNPVKDSRELKDFLSKWKSDYGSNSKLNIAKMNLKNSSGKDVPFPLLNLVSICALLVWQPANPLSPITRILFPGSTPQSKIFESLAKLKHLEFLKYPTCTGKSLAAAQAHKINKNDKIIPEMTTKSSGKAEKNSSDTVGKNSGKIEKNNSETIVKTPGKFEKTEAGVKNLGKVEKSSNESIVKSSAKNKNISSSPMVSGLKSASSGTKMDKIHTSTNGKSETNSTGGESVSSKISTGSKREPSVKADARKNETPKNITKSSTPPIDNKSRESRLSKFLVSKTPSSTSANKNTPSAPAPLKVKKIGAVSGTTSPKKEADSTSNERIEKVSAPSAPVPKYGISKAISKTTAPGKISSPKQSKEENNRKVVEHKVKNETKVETKPPAEKKIIKAPVKEVAKPKEKPEVKPKVPAPKVPKVEKDEKIKMSRPGSAKPKEIGGQKGKIEKPAPKNGTEKKAVPRKIMGGVGLVAAGAAAAGIILKKDEGEPEAKIQAETNGSSDEKREEIEKTNEAALEISGSQTEATQIEVDKTESKKESSTDDHDELLDKNEKNLEEGTTNLGFDDEEDEYLVVEKSIDEEEIEKEFENDEFEPSYSSLPIIPSNLHEIEMEKSEPFKIEDKVDDKIENKMEIEDIEKNKEENLDMVEKIVSGSEDEMILQEEVIEKSSLPLSQAQKKDADVEEEAQKIAEQIEEVDPDLILKSEESTPKFIRKLEEEELEDSLEQKDRDIVEDGEELPKSLEYDPHEQIEKSSQNVENSDVLDENEDLVESEIKEDVILKESTEKYEISDDKKNEDVEILNESNENDENLSEKTHKEPEISKESDEKGEILDEEKHEEREILTESIEKDGTLSEEHAERETLKESIEKDEISGKAKYEDSILAEEKIEKVSTSENLAEVIDKKDLSDEKLAEVINEEVSVSVLENLTEVKNEKVLLDENITEIKKEKDEVLSDKKLTEVKNEEILVDESYEKMKIEENLGDENKTHENIEDIQPEELLAENIVKDIIKEPMEKVNDKKATDNSQDTFIEIKEHDELTEANKEKIVAEETSKKVEQNDEPTISPTKIIEKEENIVENKKNTFTHSEEDKNKNEDILREDIKHDTSRNKTVLNEEDEKKSAHLYSEDEKEGERENNKLIQSPVERLEKNNEIESVDSSIIEPCNELDKISESQISLESKIETEENIEPLSSWIEKSEKLGESPVDDENKLNKYHGEKDGVFDNSVSNEKKDFEIEEVFESKKNPDIFMSPNESKTETFEKLDKIGSSEKLDATDGEDFSKVKKMVQEEKDDEIITQDKKIETESVLKKEIDEEKSSPEKEVCEKVTNLENENVKADLAEIDNIKKIDSSQDDINDEINIKNHDLDTDKNIDITERSISKSPEFLIEKTSSSSSSKIDKSSSGISGGSGILPSTEDFDDSDDLASSPVPHSKESSKLENETEILHEIESETSEIEKFSDREIDTTEESKITQDGVEKNLEIADSLSNVLDVGKLSENKEPEKTENVSNVEDNSLKIESKIDIVDEVSSSAEKITPKNIDAQEDGHELDNTTKTENKGQDTVAKTDVVDEISKEKDIATKDKYENVCETSKEEDSLTKIEDVNEPSKEQENMTKTESVHEISQNQDTATKTDNVYEISKEEDDAAKTENIHEISKEQESVNEIKEETIKDQENIDKPENVFEISKKQDGKVSQEGENVHEVGKLSEIVTKAQEKRAHDKFEEMENEIMSCIECVAGPTLAVGVLGSTYSSQPQNVKKNVGESEEAECACERKNISLTFDECNVELREEILATEEKFSKMAFMDLNKDKQSDINVSPEIKEEKLFEDVTKELKKVVYEDIESDNLEKYKDDDKEKGKFIAEDKREKKIEEENKLDGKTQVESQEEESELEDHLDGKNKMDDKIKEKGKDVKIEVTLLNEVKEKETQDKNIYEKTATGDDEEVEKNIQTTQKSPSKENKDATTFKISQDDNNETKEKIELEKDIKDIIVEKIEKFIEPITKIPFFSGDVEEKELKITHDESEKKLELKLTVRTPDEVAELPSHYEVDSQNILKDSEVENTHETYSPEEKNKSGIESILEKDKIEDKESEKVEEKPEIEGKHDFDPEKIIEKERENLSSYEPQLNKDDNLRSKNDKIVCEGNVKVPTMSSHELMLKHLDKDDDEDHLELIHEEENEISSPLHPKTPLEKIEPLKMSDTSFVITPSTPPANLSEKVRSEFSSPEEIAKNSNMSEDSSVSSSGMTIVTQIENIEDSEVDEKIESEIMKSCDFSTSKPENTESKSVKSKLDEGAEDEKFIETKDKGVALIKEDKNVIDTLVKNTEDKQQEFEGKNAQDKMVKDIDIEEVKDIIFDKNFEDKDSAESIKDNDNKGEVIDDNKFNDGLKDKKTEDKNYTESSLDKKIQDNSPDGKSTEDKVKSPEFSHEKSKISPASPAEKTTFYFEGDGDESSDSAKSDDDTDKKSENDDEEIVYEIGSIIKAGLLTAANTISATIIRKSPKEIAEVSSLEESPIREELKNLGKDISPHKSEKVDKLDKNIDIEKEKPNDFFNAMKKSFEGIESSIAGIVHDTAKNIEEIKNSEDEKLEVEKVKKSEGSINKDEKTKDDSKPSENFKEDKKVEVEKPIFEAMKKSFEQIETTISTMVQDVTKNILDEEKNEKIEDKKPVSEKFEVINKDEKSKDDMRESESPEKIVKEEIPLFESMKKSFEQIHTSFTNIIKDDSKKSEAEKVEEEERIEKELCADEKSPKIKSSSSDFMDSLESASEVIFEKMKIRSTSTSSDKNSEKNDEEDELSPNLKPSFSDTKIKSDDENKIFVNFPDTGKESKLSPNNEILKNIPQTQDTDLKNAQTIEEKDEKTPFEKMTLDAMEVVEIISKLEHDVKIRGDEISSMRGKNQNQSDESYAPVSEIKLGEEKSDLRDKLDFDDKSISFGAKAEKIERSSSSEFKIEPKLDLGDESYEIEREEDENLKTFKKSESGPTFVKMSFSHKSSGSENEDEVNEPIFKKMTIVPKTASPDENKHKLNFDDVKELIVSAMGEITVPDPKISKEELEKDFNSTQESVKSEPIFEKVHLARHHGENIKENLEEIHEGLEKIVKDSKNEDKDEKNQNIATGSMTSLFSNIKDTAFGIMKIPEDKIDHDAKSNDYAEINKSPVEKREKRESESLESENTHKEKIQKTDDGESYLPEMIKSESHESGNENDKKSREIEIKNSMIFSEGASSAQIKSSEYTSSLTGEFNINRKESSDEISSFQKHGSYSHEDEIPKELEREMGISQIIDERSHGEGAPGGASYFSQLSETHEFPHEQFAEKYSGSQDELDQNFPDDYPDEHHVEFSTSVGPDGEKIFSKKVSMSSSRRFSSLDTPETFSYVKNPNTSEFLRRGSEVFIPKHLDETAANFKIPTSADYKADISQISSTIGQNFEIPSSSGDKFEIKQTTTTIGQNFEIPSSSDDSKFEIRQNTTIGQHFEIPSSSDDNKFDVRKDTTTIGQNFEVPTSSADSKFNIGQKGENFDISSTSPVYKFVLGQTSTPIGQNFEILSSSSRQITSNIDQIPSSTDHKSQIGQSSPLNSPIFKIPSLVDSKFETTESFTTSGQTEIRKTFGTTGQTFETPSSPGSKFETGQAFTPTGQTFEIPSSAPSKFETGQSFTTTGQTFEIPSSAPSKFETGQSFTTTGQTFEIPSSAPSKFETGQGFTTTGQTYEIPSSAPSKFETGQGFTTTTGQTFEIPSSAPSKFETGQSFTTTGQTFEIPSSAPSKFEIGQGESSGGSNFKILESVDSKFDKKESGPYQTFIVGEKVEGQSPYYYSSHGDSGGDYYSISQTHLDEGEYSSGDFSDSQQSTVPISSEDTGFTHHSQSQFTHLPPQTFDVSTDKDAENGNNSYKKEETSTLSTTTTSFSSSSDNGNLEPQWASTTTTTRGGVVGGVEGENITTIVTRDSSGAENIRTTTSSTSVEEEMTKKWGKPLGLPVINPDDVSLEPSEKLETTPKKDDKMQSKPTPKMPTKRSSSSYRTKNSKPIYVDLAYVPHHGNSNYSDSEFFKLIRSRYYVFSGLEPSREVFDGLLRGKQEWEDKNLDVTIVPTYDTDTLGFWVADSEPALAAAKIDLAPSASRCTINLQDHETSCSAYRLEF